MKNKTIFSLPNDFRTHNADRILDQKFFLWFVITTLCLFLQFIPYINYIMAISVFFFVVFCFYKKWQTGLIPILALSFLHGDESISVYTLKISGVSLFYILILTLFVLKVALRRSISKYEIIFASFFCVYLAYSILRFNFVYTTYFVNDTLFLLIGVLFLFSIYDFQKIEFEKLLLSISMGYFFVKIIVFVSGIGLQVQAYSATIDQYSAIFDPIENFLIIFNLQSLFFPKNREVRYLSLFNISLFGMSAYLLTYIHGSTLVLIMIALLYTLLRNVKVLIFIVFFCVIFLSLVTTIDVNSLLGMQDESVFIYKVEKVVGLFNFVYDSNISIYDLPRSTQVRLIETANLFGQNPLSLIFGTGFGGYVTETLYSYGSYLNADDYSLDQIETGKFHILHAYNQILLKHGLFSFVVAVCIFWNFKWREDRNFRDAALIFLIISYSFTIKPFLILSLLIYSFKGKYINNTEM